MMVFRVIVPRDPKELWCMNVYEYMLFPEQEYPQKPLPQIELDQKQLA